YKFSDFDYDQDNDIYTKKIAVKHEDLGKYTVTEKNYNDASGAAVVVTYKVGNAEATGTTATVTVGEGKSETVEFNNEYPSGKLTVHVTEKNSGKDVPDAEVEIEDKDGTKTTYKTNEKGEVTDENGDVLEVLPEDYKVTVTKVPEGYDVTTGETGTVTVPDGGEGHHEAVIETDRGGIIITVLDEKTNLPVKDATIEVTEPDGTKKTYTTDENGQVTDYAKKDEYGNYTAETGDYTYKVTQVPVGYHVTVGEEQTGTVETGKLTELEAKIATEDTGKLTIHVIEEKSGRDVKNAEVEVQYPDGEKKTYITDENGNVTDENGKTLIVPPGTYSVTIVKVPEGYDVTTGETGVVVVPKDDEGHHEAVIATDRGGILITVYDEITGDVVPNATIVVTQPDGTKREFVTDENGQVTEYAKTDEFGNYTAEPGEYTYKVTEVPEGYRVTVGEEQVAEVKVSELTELEAKIALKTGGLDIKVVDEVTKKPVEGATVEVEYPDGSVKTFVTDKDGMVTELSKQVDGRYTAKIGTYKITVTKVPEGYKVTTGKTVEEVIEVDQLKHHVAEIATATKKDTNTVQTGDSTPIALFIGMMIFSAAGAAFVISRKRKNAR
ncbi:MAG: LPXTG cell wall anchor domain-containing protein, partial [Eubacterium sp.]|nr:LPXTG cell wall anchor domain-containing protein [Eubacterium sp.]